MKQRSTHLCVVGGTVSVFIVWHYYYCLVFALPPTLSSPVHPITTSSDRISERAFSADDLATQQQTGTEMSSMQAALRPTFHPNPSISRRYRSFFSPITALTSEIASTVDDPTLPLLRRVLRVVTLREPLAQLFHKLGFSSDIMFLRAIGGITSTLVYAILIVTVLGTLGVDTKPILTTLGLSGFMVGFGMQHIATNLLSGLLLVIQRPMRVDWKISVAGHTGRVKGIDSRYVILEEDEGYLILIPSFKVYSSDIKAILFYMLLPREIILNLLFYLLKGSITIRRY